MINREIEKNKRPRICCIDLKSDDFSELAARNYNLFNGSLGAVVNLPILRKGDTVNLTLDYAIPDNFHEFDMLIVDLLNESIKEYESEPKLTRKTRDRSTVELICKYPTTTFDPRPLAASILSQGIKQVSKRPFIQIVFACEQYFIDYEFVEITGEYPKSFPIERRYIYDFMTRVPLSNSIYGTEINICDDTGDFKSTLEKYLKNSVYEQTFNVPRNLRDDDQNTRFVPLLKDINDDVVSYLSFENNLITIVLPNFKKKGLLLNDLIAHILPAIAPSVFPNSTEFRWLRSDDYFLPNQVNILKERDAIHLDYSKKLLESEDKENQNYKKYQFLHEMLTETGDPLVRSIYKYLKWLEFDNVKIQDDHSTGILEEDLQIQLDSGLLIIEAKGIGGTSTDSNCAQISKIKHRRWKERQAFDVYALYVVNHQRYLPPLERKNPPFTREQISDAENDERGLLSTWQLFKLYFDIENGLISKEEARLLFLTYGLVQFRPKTKKQLPAPKQIIKDSHVVVLNITNQALEVGQTLILEKGDKFFKVQIQSIQVNGKFVENVSDGEVGLKLTAKVSKGTNIWTV